MGMETMGPLLQGLVGAGSVAAAPFTGGASLIAAPLITGGLQAGGIGSSGSGGMFGNVTGGGSSTAPGGASGLMAPLMSGLGGMGKDLLGTALTGGMKAGLGGLLGGGGGGGTPMPDVEGLEPLQLPQLNTRGNTGVTGGGMQGPGMPLTNPSFRIPRYY